MPPQRPPQPPKSTAATTYKALSRLSWVSATMGVLGGASIYYLLGGWFPALAQTAATLGGLWCLGSAGLAFYWGRKSKRIGQDFGERQVLHAIEQRGGKITAAELASKTGMPLSESDNWLKKLSDEGHAELEVTKKGTLLYVVPGFVPEEDRQQSRGALQDPIDEFEDVLNQFDQPTKARPASPPPLPERE